MEAILGESLLNAKRAEKAALSEFGKCVMELAQKKGVRSQAALRRKLEAHGLSINPRTFATYLTGRTVVDPALPPVLLSVLRLNKTERRALAEAFTFGQPPRHHIKPSERRVS